MSRLSVISLVAVCLVAIPWSHAGAQIAPLAPSGLVDQGQNDARLAGVAARLGIKVEVAADKLASRLPLAIAFDGGSILVLEAGTAAAPEQLVKLSDADADGTLEKSAVVMSELAGRTSLLVADGWYYFAGGGTVIRRRAFVAPLAAELQASAEAKKGPPTAVTADKKWIEQILVRGLADKPADQTGGLALALDGSIYLAIGGTASRAASWDGSQATVLGGGAIFRFEPDGSRVREFARGLAAPIGPPARDAFGSLFQADRLPTGSRIVHVLEAGDYGWRADLDPPRLDRPGTLPALLTSAAPAPEALLVYYGAALPKPLQGALMTAGTRDRVVQAHPLESAGNSFAARQPVELVRGEPAKFVPRLIAQGPEGAVYIVDTRAAGTRILRLTWSGTKDAPAIQTPALAAFVSKPAPQADELALAVDKSKPAAERSAALGRACRAWDKATLDGCLTLLADENADLARLAADALGDHLPNDKEAQEQMAAYMQDKLLSAPLPVRRSLYLALGKLGTKLDTVPEWIFEATSVTPDVHTNRHLFQAHGRAAEIPPGWATELMLGNLEVALFDVNPEPEERVRLKKFVVATAEQMRTRELAGFLDKAIRDEKDYFSKLEAPLQTRLLAAYQNVLVEPAIHADAVALWLDKHPQAALEVQQAAWETLAKVGASKPELIIGPAKALVSSGKLDASLKPHVLAALTRHRDPAKRGEVDALIDAVNARATQRP